MRIIGPGPPTSLRVPRSSMKIGYARVSTQDQNLALQLRALESTGCERIYTDQGYSGSTTARPGLKQAMQALQCGDTFVVWRLDRLGRSLVSLVDMVSRLKEGGVEFVSLSEHIDTASSAGRLVFHMMAALAEFERSLISERTRAGMAAARYQGRHMGRPLALTEEQLKEARVELQREPIAEVAQRYGIHPRTLQRLAARTDALLAQKTHVESVADSIQKDTIATEKPPC